MMIESQVAIRVRYAETDQMGVVYHANYLPWFESARIQLLDDVGFPYSALEAAGMLLPVIRCGLEFKRPARFDDRLRVVVRMSEVPVVRLRLSYEVSREETLLATGTTEHAFMSPDGRVLRPKADFIQAIRARLASNGN